MYVVIIVVVEVAVFVGIDVVVVLCDVSLYQVGSVREYCCAVS